jgi:uncharacterized protein (TIGR03067 family)
MTAHSCFEHHAFASATAGAYGRIRHCEQTMKSTTFLLIALPLAMFCIPLCTPSVLQGQDPKKEDLLKKEREMLEGTWTVKSFQQAGKPLPDDIVKGLKVVIKGEQITTSNEGKKVDEVTYQVDPAKDPKIIEWRHDGKVIAKGTYLLDKDMLLLNMAGEDKVSSVIQLQRAKR